MSDTTCPACKGDGWLMGDMACDVCGGTGQVPAEFRGPGTVIDEVTRDAQGQSRDRPSPNGVAPELERRSQGDKRDGRDKRPARRTSWTAAELMAETFPEPKWAVPELVAEGLGLLVGPPKGGKSWLSLGLGIAVASGGIALGSIEVEQGPALYLALEDTPRRLKNRLHKMIPDGKAPGDLTISVECEPIAVGGRERIERWLDEHPAARLVVLDVLAKVRGPAINGESKYDGDYRAITELKSLADEAGVAFLVVHHTRKMDAEDFVETVSGTQGLTGAADSIALLKRTRGKADGILSVTGRDIEEAEHALRFAADLGAWQLTDTPVVELQRTDTENAIVKWLTDNEGVGPKATADGTGLDHEAVKKAMRRMADKGFLDTDGQGHYFVPKGEPL